MTSVSRNTGSSIRAAGRTGAAASAGRRSSITNPSATKSAAEAMRTACWYAARSGSTSAPIEKAASAYTRSASAAPAAANKPAAKPRRAAVPKIRSAIGPIDPARTAPNNSDLRKAAPTAPYRVEGQAPPAAVPVPVASCQPSAAQNRISTNQLAAKARNRQRTLLVVK